MATRRRLDAELVRRGLVTSRTEAGDAVGEQRVLVNGAVADKPARLVASGDALVVTGPPPRFVGRGGEKLDAALARFGIAVTGLRALDVGASTGGLTDCLLARGAREVVALDVGHGQLHPRIRADPRVVVLERTNARYLSRETLGDAVDVVVVDASFIGIEKLLSGIVAVLREGGTLVALVKPQFEAGRAEAARARGVIRDPSVRDAAIAKARAAIVAAGFEVLGEVDSALKGPKGNRERFVWARRVAPSDG